MRVAVLADIHGNMDALEAVLEDLDRAAVDEVVSAGDNIGYGAEPDRVVLRLASLGIPSVLGNHELAARNPAFLEWFNPEARESLIWTAGRLSAESMEYVDRLPTHRVAHGCRWVHGYPPDSVSLYMFQVPASRRRMTLTESEERFCFVGHTHRLELVAFDGRELQQRELQEGSIALDPACKYLINIGSVGQPRDGDIRAKFGILDLDRQCLEIRCLPYDNEAAAAKIRSEGLPEIHARRLLE
jgi:diadenosine tetraphosphatase ApaH/serine/threonine PP2A family protein phosphatase